MPKAERSASGRQWGLLALVALIGLNLRPFLTAPGPILSSVAADTGMGYGGLAMLTLLPMLLMGLGAFVAPTIQAIVGTRRGMLVALLMLMLGSLLRLGVPDGASLILTAAGCGRAWPSSRPFSQASSRHASRQTYHR